MPDVPHRRQTIVIGLVACAVIGAVLRLAAPNPSALRDLGTLLLVLWLPVIGNVVGFLMRKLPRRAPELPFDPDQPFTPHLRAELTPLPGPGGVPRRLPAPGALCTVVLGHEGFTARCGPLTGGPDQAGGSGPLPVVEMELSRPVLAAGRLGEGAAFVLAFGTQAVARGRVLGRQEP
jgi:hypothetical protein